jgi:murein DD-endopeptidase MepM/ murein hydrolase activator NlpD
VGQGEAMGYSGTTGFTTGEHLHFEIRSYGTPVNPRQYIDFHGY